jgi:(p)ppGpp synthase/HD superfamily hydrolase
LVRKIYPDVWRASHKKLVRPRTTALQRQEADSLTVIVDGDELINYYFCPECKPVYGDKIIAKTGRDGIKIHDVHCRSMKTVSLEKLLEAHRKGQEKNSYQVTLEFKILSEYANLLSLVNVFSELDISILNIALKNLMDGTSIVTLESLFSNPSKIIFLLNNLKKIDNSIQVVKKKIV